MTEKPTVHASAVLVGERAVLIRGPSGSGKSRLAFDLILAGRAGQVPPAFLVGDDRVHLDTSAGNLIVRPARELAGLIEIRGLGIRRIEHVGEAVVGLVVDLAAEDGERGAQVPSVIGIGGLGHVGDGERIGHGHTATHAQKSRGEGASTEKAEHEPGH